MKWGFSLCLGHSNISAIIMHVACQNSINSIKMSFRVILKSCSSSFSSIIKSDALVFFVLLYDNSERKEHQKVSQTNFPTSFILGRYGEGLQKGGTTSEVNLIHRNTKYSWHIQDFLLSLSRCFGSCLLVLGFIRCLPLINTQHTGFCHILLKLGSSHWFYWTPGDQPVSKNGCNRSSYKPFSYSLLLISAAVKRLLKRTAVLRENYTNISKDLLWTNGNQPHSPSNNAGLCCHSPQSWKWSDLWNVYPYPLYLEEPPETFIQKYVWIAISSL